MTFAAERVRKDLESLLPTLPPWIRLCKREELAVHFEMTPESGPFAYQTSLLTIRVPVAYPFQPPKLQLEGPVREKHPCVDPKTGAVCMDVLRLGWRPSIGLDSLVYGMALMLEDPLDMLEHDSAVLNEEALRALRKCRLLNS